MTRPERKNLPASIHERLLSKAKSSGRPFNELLQYYAIERLLYRLAQSPHRDRFILKGALIFAVWGAPLSRPTRDIDLLAHTSNAIDNIVAIVTAICNQDVQPDGMTFDPASVVGDKIKEQDEYEGVRVRFRGYLGNARVNMQVDMGFADVVSPAPQLVEYPILLDLPRPHLRGYPRETVVAEKVHAMVTLGATNSRMKDFYDLWLLARKFDFDGALLSEATRNTFAHRNTQIPNQMPIGLTDEFARDNQTQWQAFVRTGKIDDAPQELATVLAELGEFLLPMLRNLSMSQSLSERWRAPGPWHAPSP